MASEASRLGSVCSSRPACMPKACSTRSPHLAASTEKINASVPAADSPVASLVAGVLEPGEPAGPDPILLPGDGSATVTADPADRGAGEIRPTFHIVPGAPRGQSFASAIARQHGIAFEQLRQKLGERGLLPART